jgi:hypothetical protein
MVIYAMIGPDNVIQGYGSSRNLDTDIELDLPEDHLFLKSPTLYRYIDGELVRFSQEEIDEMFNGPKPMTAEERIADLENMVLQLLMGF